ncbi:MAG: hypothetical protein E3J72_20020 [Planctomycetota bacterium]|nr:MAG: hypothetical protein E3J72_20020 [Planctomycetota bacterium]
MSRSDREKYKRRHAFMRTLGWYLFIPFMRLLYVLPLSFELAAAPVLGYLVYLLNRRLVKRACNNLKMALGEKYSHPERKRIVRDYYINAVRCLFEFIHFKSMGSGYVRDVVHAPGFVEKVNEIREAGKGCILISGHVNNWELMGAFVALHWPTSVVGKRIYFDKFNEAVVSARESRGYHTIYQDEPPRKLLGALRKNEIVGIVPDQDVARINGTFVDFFGTPAFTPTAPVSMARVSGAPVLVIFLIRRGSAHRMIFFEPFHVPRDGDKDAVINEFTARWVAMEEEVIRRWPAQWPWIHRRWKTRPEGESPESRVPGPGSL